MADGQEIAIGIDLGTTYSCVGVWKNDRVEIIPNEHGNRTTPSYVAFTDKKSQVLVGDSAKTQADRNPANTVFDSKRLIGRRFSDQSTTADLKHFPYTVIPKKNDQPYIELSMKGEKKLLSPVLISSIVIAKMKRAAETYLKQKVTSAVITVPAYFNDAQRMATKQAGTVAGLKVLRIINEPTAAALAYGLSQKIGGDEVKERVVLVFDLGGGTFDVSLLTMADGIFEVRATAGNTHLGGEDFDNRLVGFFQKKVKSKCKIDISGDAGSMRKLRTACEKAKCQLSTATESQVNLKGVAGAEDFSSTITRIQFEELCLDLFRLTMDPVEKVLQDGNMTKEMIDEIVLVGGSTRIPRIQDMLSQAFNGKALCKEINPDEAVAYGATVQAAVLSGVKSAVTKDILLLDVIPLSLGIETSGGLMSRLIRRNTTIPTCRTDIFSTTEHNQEEVIIQVFEGERSHTKYNNLLGSFALQGIPKARRGDPTIHVKFDIDANGILNVSAEDKDSGKKNEITIANDESRLSNEDIERMVEDAALMRDEDEIERSRFIAQSTLERRCIYLKETVERKEVVQAVSQDDSDRVCAEADRSLEWIKQNPNATEEDFDRVKETLLAVAKPFIEKVEMLTEPMNAHEADAAEKTGGFEISK